MSRETNILDYLAFLQDLDKAKEPYFLEGGPAYQAAAFTARPQSFLPHPPPGRATRQARPGHGKG